MKLKTSLNSNEKTGKLILSGNFKASTEKKVKSRTGSNNNKHTLTQSLATGTSSIHSTKNVSAFNKILDRTPPPQTAVSSMSTQQRLKEKKSSIKGTSSLTSVPQIEMNKLMQGASFDTKKPSGISSIRTNTNRTTAGGFTLAPHKESSGNPKSSHGTPSSSINAQYMPGKKSKRP